MRLSRAGIIGMCAVGCLLLVTSAQADIKSYHGTFCKPKYTSETEVVYHSYGIRAGGEDGAYVRCPVIRDHMFSSTQVDGAVMEVYNAGGNLNCTFYTQYEDVSGATFDSSYDNTTSTGADQLDFGSLSTYAGNEGAYVISCYLPENGRIYHYLINEEDSAY